MYITVKVAHIFHVIFFLLAVPFVVFIDVIFRNADIIFVSPTGMSILLFFILSYLTATSFRIKE